MNKTSHTPKAISSDAYYFEKDKAGAILVMGVGNYLMGDEGIGVRLIEEMAREALPEYLELLDGGTGGFLLLDRFQAYRTVIFVDATMDGKPAGSISLLRPKFASDFPSALSVHDLGLKDMIEAVYLLEHEPELYLLTISIDHIDPMSLDLSKPVEDAIPEAIQKILTLSRELHLQKLSVGDHH
ncbi:hydrogenase maturation protease [Robiginitalea marina]|uniref:Hydrogenase maturation protease n=1 Tax=Robiginitalea marina TaxID=2954105 RepID=A0ABT1B003_9FLAO|nr:hydrogenase maturation protease [Robiginitalea marina]MCO5725567.1 hydrogenase maturation protease [Robiginitalea marina]